MEKAKYRVTRLSHIHNNLWPEGSEIEYEGEPGTALEPLNDAARSAKAKAKHKVESTSVVAALEPLNDAARSAKAKAKHKVESTSVVAALEPLNDAGRSAKAKAKHKVESTSVVAALEPLNDAGRSAKAKAKHKVESTSVVAALEPLNDAGADDGLDKLREDYELLFNEKPHHNTKAETLREKIAEKRAELGV